MKRRGRIRRTAKWAATASLILVVVAWATSTVGGFALNVPISTHVLCATWLSSGAVGIQIVDVADLGLNSADIPWWGRWNHSGELCWLPSWWTEPGLVNHSLLIPLWCFAAVLGPVAGFLWWRDRRPRSGLCACGYALAGLPAGVPCPECGKSERGPV